MIKTKPGCPFCNDDDYRNVDVNLFFTGKEYYCKKCGYVFAIYDSKTGKTIDLDENNKYKSSGGLNAFES